MVRTSRLDVNAYEEVEADTGATSQALTVVVLSALASGVAAAIGAATAGSRPGMAEVNPLGALIGGILIALIGWAVWSFVVYFVGTRLLGGTATYGELLRTLGFANSPGVLNIFGFVPVLGGIIGLIVAIWTLITGFIATRQALDIDNGKTVATIIVAFIALLIVYAILGTVFALIGLGAGLMRMPFGA